MPTMTLADAIRLFDPQHPLTTDQLDAYYVQRPHAPLQPIKTYLRAMKQEPVKILFSGHRGSGKSTELTRLAKDLENEFFGVRTSARSLNPADLNYVDVVLACAASLFREATSKAGQVKIPAALWRGVLDLLTSEVIAETTIKVPKAGSIGAKVNALVFSIEGKYGKETETRQTMRRRLLPYVNDLIEQTNGVCRELDRVTGRPPLIIFEDLDKPDMDAARALFFDHATTLNSMACHVIYTFPISLCYSNEFRARVREYSNHFLLPNVHLYHRDDTPHPEGREVLKSVVTRRISEDLFDRAALNLMVELSGGLMRDLTRLVRDAALQALTDGKPIITPDVVQWVAAGIANEYRRVLLPEHYDALREARKTKQIIPHETVRQLLLENLSAQLS